MANHYKILIIDDNADDYELCDRMLRKNDCDTDAYFELRHAANGVQGIEEIEREPPDCILLDYSFPGSDGLSVLNDIKKYDANLPVIVLTGQGNEAIAVNLLKSGAQDYIVKSDIHDNGFRKKLIKCIRSHHSESSQLSKEISAIKIFIIDDNTDDRELIIRNIRKIDKNSYEFIESSSGSNVLDLIRIKSPHCVFLDYSLPGEDGLAVLQKIFNHYPFIPVVLLSGQGSEYIAAEAIKKGAFHYLNKSEITPGLLEKTVNQGMENKQLEFAVYEKTKELKQHQSNSIIGKRRFDRVVQAANIVVWEYDIERGDLFVEEQIENLLGKVFDCQSLSFKAFCERIHPDDIEKYEFNFDLRLKGGDERTENIYRLRNERDNWVWIRETGSVVEFNKDGVPIQAAGILEDISNRKHEEEVFNKLHVLAIDSNISFDEKISQVLHLGIKYFDLDLAVIGKVDNDVYHVLYYQEANNTSIDKKFILSDIYCNHVFDKGKVKAWHNVGKSEVKDSSFYRESQVESYIGVTIFLNQTPYGTLNFSKKALRNKPFSQREKTLMNLMGQWVSSEITREANLREIEESKNFLQLVQDSIPDLIFVKDKDFRIVRANPAFLNVYPKSVRDSVLGTTTVESYNKDEADAFLMHDRIALNTGYSETEETILFPDGKERTLHTKKIRFKDTNDDSFILGVGRDITDFKQAESDRNELHEAMTNTVEGISQIDQHGRYVYVNEAYASTCGYTPDELLGEKWELTVEEKEHEALNKAYQRMLEAGKVTKETQGVRKDGTLFYKRVTMISRYDSNGKFVGHHCFMNDISKNKRAEARLAESEERYELAVKGSSVGLWDWNVKTGELFWSDRFKEIIGISDTEFRPRYEEFSERLHPKDKEETETALFSHVEKGTPYDVEYRLKRVDNTYVWVHARGQAIWDEQGNATRMAGSVDDISQSKSAQEELIHSNLELERFAYVASHDLQEPLRMVTNFTQLLEKRYSEKLDDRGLEYIKHASNGALRMQTLVRDLLTYARIGNEAEKFQLTDLNTLKESIQENLLASINQSGATIEWDTLPTILADPAHIRSLFQNLIGNAIKYRKNDIPPKVLVKAIEKKHQWVFSIKDNGIGMKQQYCEQIFEPFKRLHRKEEYQGTGMGLSICRKAVEVMGGKIWAVSSLGEGSTFYFSLPKAVQ